MKEPKSIEEAREWLNNLANYLEEVPNASSLLVFASKAIRGYLDGQHKSLNHAFGLVRSAGRQKRRSKHFELALKVWL